MILPVASLLHALRHGRGTADDPLDIDLHHPVEPVPGCLQRRLLVEEPGIVDQDVDPPVLLQYLTDHGVHLSGDSHVGLNAEGAAPGRGDGFTHLFGQTAIGGVVDGHRGSLLGKGQGDRPAYAARGSRDQGHLVLQSQSVCCHRLPR